MSLPNVAYDPPPNPPASWTAEALLWDQLNQAVNGNQQFKPLTVKAAYVIGTMHGLCRSVSILLDTSGRDPVPYMAAYGVFAAGIELLGRCLNGYANVSGNAVENLKTGLKFLDTPNNYAAISDAHLTLTTSVKGYTIDELAQLRHFAAHGQATTRTAMNVDFDLLGGMPTRIGNALEWYWSNLQTASSIGEKLCEDLAAANVLPFREFPIWETWKEFADQSSGRHRAISKVFFEFDWKV